MPGKPQTQPVAIVGATVHPISGPAIPDGTIVFDRGKIRAIGKGAAIPAGARVIRARGKHIYPGLISAETTLGLVEIGAVRATRDYSETGDINPNVRAEVAVNPDSELFAVTRANGIALGLSVPEGGLISGTSALLMLDGWTWEEMTLKAPVGLHIHWPMPAGAADESGGYPRREARSDRDMQLEKIKEAFRSARSYMTAQTAETAGAPRHDTDSRWEAMIPVLKRHIPVFVHARHLRQIEEAVLWADEENLRVVIVGGYDAWRAADLLKRQNVPVIIGGIHNLPLRGYDRYDDWFVLPKRLHEAGLRVCISDGGGGFGAPMSRNLPYHAGTAAAHGLPRDEALKAVTINCADILGVADRVGSLEPGKDATLIVTDGDPLEIPTTVERMFIQGREVDLSSKHTQLYEKYREKYRRLGIYRGP
jgi:imidazolonepropionase-like amidohydrolase